MREALGTVFTHKYAEGLPGRRYYGGCAVVDAVEETARDRAKELFGAEHANVQPHSGTQANMAAYFALLKPGERLLGMGLSHGGHLTHGSSANFSGRLYDVAAYGVREEDGLVDYDALREQALRERPKVIVAGTSAYPRVLDFEILGGIAVEAGAVLVADIAHVAGLVAGRQHPSPFPHAPVVTTTTHKTLRGPRGGLVMCTEEHSAAIDRAVFPCVQGGPLMHVVAAKAVAFGEALRPSFDAYAARIVANARALARVLLERGVKLVSGGTDTHLVLVDLRDTDLTGKDAEVRLERAGITVNKNTVPGETRSPFVTSGLRIGTPALATRGMGPAEMEVVGTWIADLLLEPADEDRVSRVRNQVADLCAAFPLYQEAPSPAQSLPPAQAPSPAQVLSPAPAPSSDEVPSSAPVLPPDQSLPPAQALAPASASHKIVAS